MLGFEAAAGLGVICGRGRAGRQAGWPRQWAAAQSSESPQKSRQSYPGHTLPCLASLLPVVTLHRDCDQVTLLKVEQPPSFIARKNTHDQQVPGRLPMLRLPYQRGLIGCGATVGQAVPAIPPQSSDSSDPKPMPTMHQPSHQPPITSH